MLQRRTSPPAILAVRRDRPRNPAPTPNAPNSRPSTTASSTTSRMAARSSRSTRRRSTTTTTAPIRSLSPATPKRSSKKTSRSKYSRPTILSSTGPNKITPADFNNWVEERGHGFIRQWDPHYVALHRDARRRPGPAKGRTPLRPDGKRHDVYMAYAFFRQMPDGVPGSYRIMANLISMRKRPGLRRKIAAPQAVAVAFAVALALLSLLLFLLSSPQAISFCLCF